MSTTTTTTTTVNHEGINNVELVGGPYLDGWRHRINKYQRRVTDINDVEYRHDKMLRVMFKKRRNYLYKSDWKRSDLNDFDVVHRFVKKDQEKDKVLVRNMFQALKNFKRDCRDFNMPLHRYRIERVMLKTVLKQYYRKKFDLYATVIKNHPYFNEYLSDDEKQMMSRELFLDEGEAGFIPILP